ncbi:YetF domain-containing protein [Clostridium aciditolerans]|uniref:DUF421 domain-containing protein n=1 Tax=Clostridium aciditolerans TaxID=339861 RepID=A0A934HQG4_9CLOT|nr:DUF421 domain-containing protein [Clostridium aciditolerans]MBI6871383.1 DUF421 domain-containing protein [Clostridium aciditolerans]
MFEPFEIILRVFLALIMLLGSTRFLSKRTLSKLTYFDYVAAVTLGTVAGNLAFNLKVHILNFILCMVLIPLIVMAISYLSFKYKCIRKIFAGESTILIKNGKILKNNLASLNFSYEYLSQQLRQEKIFDINQVELAILEPSGKLSVQLKSQNRPLTPQDLNMPTKYEGSAIELVLDGKIIEKNLIYLNKSENWLYSELNRKGIKNINKVAFAALSTNGKIYYENIS